MGGGGGDAPPVEAVAILCQQLAYGQGLQSVLCTHGLALAFPIAPWTGGFQGSPITFGRPT